MTISPRPIESDGFSSQEAGDETVSTQPGAVRCPFCGSPDVEPMALFGSQLMTQQCYCRACRTPFERVRDED